MLVRMLARFSVLIRWTNRYVRFARHLTTIADLTLPHPQPCGSYRVLSVSAELRNQFSKKYRSGRQFQQKLTLAVSQRQCSQRHFDYILQFIAACATRSLDRHSEDNRRDVAGKISWVHGGRQITF